jgi:hypothetical protein
MSNFGFTLFWQPAPSMGHFDAFRLAEIRVSGTSICTYSSGMILFSFQHNFVSFPKIFFGKQLDADIIKSKCIFFNETLR